MKNINLIVPGVIYSYFLLVPGFIKLFFNNIDAFIFSYLQAFAFVWLIGGLILIAQKNTSILTKYSIGTVIFLFFLILVI